MEEYCSPDVISSGFLFCFLFLLFSLPSLIRKGDCPFSLLIPFIPFLFLLFCLLSTQHEQKGTGKVDDCFSEEMAKAIFSQTTPFRFSKFGSILDELPPSWLIFSKHALAIFWCALTLGISIHRLNDVWCCRYWGVLFSLCVQTSINLK